MFERCRAETRQYTELLTHSHCNRGDVGEKQSVAFSPQPYDPVENIGKTGFFLPTPPGEHEKNHSP